MNNAFFSTLLLVLFCAPTLSAQQDFGEASYYADKFHGNKTAYGEKYDKNDLTCAHKTHPHNTMLKVTRMDNNKSVEVRVNDKGPHKAGRIVDLSRRAAAVIGLDKDGVAQVKVEVINPTAEASAAPQTMEANMAKKTEPEKDKTATTEKADKKPKVKLLAEGKKKPEAVAQNSAAQPKSTPPATETSFRQHGTYQVQINEPIPGTYAIQVEVLTAIDKVFSELAVLQKDFAGKTMLRIEPMNDSEVSYKLLIGPFANKEASDAFKGDVVKKGYKDCFSIQL